LSTIPSSDPSEQLTPLADGGVCLGIYTAWMHFAS